MRFYFASQKRKAYKKKSHSDDDRKKNDIVPENDKNSALYFVKIEPMCAMSFLFAQWNKKYKITKRKKHTHFKKEIIKHKTGHLTLT